MKKNNKKGFTLVELVIVVAVMAILVAVAIPTVASITGKARTAVADANAQTIESMLKLELADLDKAKLTEKDAADALAEANLGITSGTFYTDLETCNVGTATTAGDVAITFSATEVKVGEATASLTESVPETT